MGTGKEAFSNTLQSLAENFIKQPLVTIPIFFIFFENDQRTQRNTFG